MSDILHIPPIRAPRRFWMGMFGACAAPIFWLGQLILSYWVTAIVCYGSDHPTALNATGALRSMLVAFDVVAILACAAGALLSYMVLRSATRNASADTQIAGRIRFLGIWGLLSSLWFFAAILFGTIVSLGVPLCAL
jgi:uncharacterized membrane protein YjgN (DUF898 family)